MIHVRNGGTIELLQIIASERSEENVAGQFRNAVDSKTFLWDGTVVSTNDVKWERDAKVAGTGSLRCLFQNRLWNGYVGAWNF